MLPRQSNEQEITKAREALSRNGISQRDAARQLDVSIWHLNRVLRGHRRSLRLVKKLQTLLPSKPKAATHHTTTP